MKLHPHNRTVLCKMINQKNHLEKTNGIVYSKEELPIYQVVEISDVKLDLDLNVGDTIVTNSEPTRLKLEDDTYYLIKEEYIAGKVK